MSKENNVSKEMHGNTSATNTLIIELRTLITRTRIKVASNINEGITMLYWQIGRRINKEILKGKRAEYGKEILSSVSLTLSQEFGSGFSEKNIRHMMKFAEVFSNEKIVSALRRQLSWTHFKTIIYIEDPLKRDFYSEMCRIEQWSTRTLHKKIDSMLYERTALSKKSESLIKHELSLLKEKNKISPDLVFKDPYFLDFLGLKDHYLEKDLEDAILRELEQFLLELGKGFAFMARQKRIILDNDDYYIDLLFFHRGLNRLIVIDLKLGDFKAEYKGQMELYLRWLDKYERRPRENTPLGIILCAGKKREVVELLELGKSGIHVAEYLTELPPREILEQKLHRAIQQARARFEEIEAKKDLPEDDEE